MSNRQNKKRVRKPIRHSTKRRGGMNFHNTQANRHAGIRRRLAKEQERREQQYR